MENSRKEIQNHAHQLEDRDKKITSFQKEIHELQTRWDTLDRKVKEAQRIQQRDRAELTQLRSENRELKAARKQVPASDSEFGHTLERPLDFTERQVLTEGAAEKILNDLRQELRAVIQEKEDLLQQLEGEASSGKHSLPHSFIHPKTEIFRKLLEHTQPLTSVMQHYQAYRTIDLLTSNLPVLKRGITLKQVQFQELWNRANSRTRDTLAFMWAVGDFKLPLGILELVTGSPPFFIRRYILRSIASLAQHKATHAKEPYISPLLPNL